MFPGQVYLFRRIDGPELSAISHAKIFFQFLFGEMIGLESRVLPVNDRLFLHLWSIVARRCTDDMVIDATPIHSAFFRAGIIGIGAIFCRAPKTVMAGTLQEWT